MASRMSSKPKPTRLDRAPAQPTADELLHFFNQSPDLLCIAGFDGVFKRLNPAWSPLLGWSNAELHARPFLEFVHPDDRAATLAAIRYAATFLANELRQRDPAAAAKADRIGGMAGDAVTLARELARGIFPVQLDGLGLAPALEELADTTTRQTDMLVTFSETGDTRPTDPADDLHLYRNAQEALGNAAKHSAARGMGLDSMRYRARALSGELTIESLPGEGAIVACEIPNRPLATPSS